MVKRYENAAPSNGPWTYEYSRSDYHGEGEIRDSSGGLVAIVCGSNYGRWSEQGEGEYEANAALLAEAPALAAEVSRLTSIISSVQLELEGERKLRLVAEARLSERESMTHTDAVCALRDMTTT